jgi:hypothetical protein
LDSTVPPDSPAYGLVEPSDEGLAVFPGEEAGSVHARVREAPKRVSLVGNEMARGDEIIALGDYVRADRAERFAASNESHGPLQEG